MPKLKKYGSKNRTQKAHYGDVSPEYLQKNCWEAYQKKEPSEKPFVFAFLVKYPKTYNTPIEWSHIPSESILQTQELLQTIFQKYPQAKDKLVWFIFDKNGGLVESY